MPDKIIKNSIPVIGIGKAIGKSSENIGIPINSDAFRFTNSDSRRQDFETLSGSSKVFQTIAFYYTFIMEKGRSSKTHSAERKKIYKSNSRNRNCHKNHRKVIKSRSESMDSDGFPMKKHTFERSQLRYAEDLDNFG